MAGLDKGKREVFVGGSVVALAGFFYVALTPTRNF